ncbi:gamma-glutamyltransferase [Pseudophaeobacter flagellatus]|uniref:gamma-glutamyltransferase n=1 Tax=Pseudophaeobacter flagellatus TaxID=2899119 RepID=UPI001E62FFF5|nr:gamma-glutamyltransferase [Pseudophaeobacter flagellatus]MCD9149943.1 gamma-glutamyltransferase [Pseudophaeobacter flagellatus]
MKSVFLTCLTVSARAIPSLMQPVFSLSVLTLPILVLSGGGLQAKEAADAVAPEGASLGGIAAVSDASAAALAAKQAGQPVEAQDWMIAAANPHAVEAGAAVLRQGGTAADAMIAAQVVLGLVEPQSSGLGGGAFLVWYDAKTGAVTTLDARETAPLAATPQLFQDESGAPLKFFDAVVGGRSVGTPGTPALLEMAHRKWGQANWASLFETGISLAQDGFEVSPRMAGAIARDADRLGRFPATARYFLPGGTPLAAGDRLTNVAYADVLQVLAEQGAEGFYTGPIAADIVHNVQQAEGNPGVLSMMDLALYRVKERDASCASYRAFEVCGMGPPSSGALTVGQILGMLGGYDLAALGAENPESWRLIGDASRLAFADRGRYMADSDFVPVPAKGLVDPDYLAQRGQLLAGPEALAEVAPGQPEFDHAALAPLWADDVSIEFPSTSHLTIVDQYGNVLSMTTTIENGFGSRVMSNGFLLNNELTDFSFRSHRDGVPIANRIEPGKRPRSSMAPTIVLRDGAPVLAIGSPGGSRIIGYVATAIVAWADWGLDVQQALALPHAVNRFGTYDLEADTAATELEAPLVEMGYKVNIRDLNSGLHAIEIGETLKGGADPRREGIALGQ